MSDRANEIMEKMARMINTAKPEHKDTVARWISLANRELNKLFDKYGDWGIIGGSLALEEGFQAKFGCFHIHDKAICDRDEYLQGRG